MKRKKHSPEEVVRKLRQAEQMQQSGASMGEIVQALGVSEQTFYRWRKRYGGVDKTALRHLRALEHENVRLKKIVVEQALDLAMAKELNEGKW
jgi:transposase-like protein